MSNNNVYVKLQNVRVELQEMNIKKSGKNNFSGYSYYELSDFLPVINKLFQENGLFSQMCFSENEAILKIINMDKPEEVVTFTSPMKESNLKGAQPIQNLGSTQTYLRRYLYMSALEIVESDVVDSVQGKDQKNAGNKPSDKQVNYLKTLMKKANMEVDDEKVSKLNGKQVSEMIQKLKEKLG